MKRTLLLLLGFYQRWISPAFPRRCKYEPTCSRYAVEAVSELGAVKGSILAAWRLLRCNPLSNGGINVQDTTIESRDDLTIQPQPEYCALRWIAAFCQQNTDF